MEGGRQWRKQWYNIIQMGFITYNCINISQRSYLKKVKMQNKQSTLSDFQVLNKLGEGAFGQVFKVKRNLDGKEYALKKVKLVSMKPKERDNALNEIRILASYEGQNIIGYKEAFFDEISNTLCIVMEIAAQGDLLKKIQQHAKKQTKIPEDQIWKALVHMSQGLKSLHQRKILHRDLKCANVFITAEGVYKLGDLNVSKVLKKQMAETQTGTPYYASPQVWKDKPYGVKSDMWSLGCVLYEMAALKPPFTATDLQGLYKKICAGYFQRIPLNYSNELQNVIRSLLRGNPKERPTVQELLGNPTVHKNYLGEIDVKKNQEEANLLKTIKYDPRNIRGLKKILPKAKYEKQEEEKMQIQDLRGGIMSCKANRKQAEEEDDRRLKQFIRKKKQMEDKEREKQLKALKEQKQELMKKRERVLSACGGRRERYISESPKSGSKKSSNKSGVQESKKNNLPKLPPKPNGNQINQQYRLPPKPVNRVPYSNKSIDKYEEQKIESARDKSKENLRKVGENIVSGDKPVSNRIGRCNSAQKIVYPNWWC